MTDKPIIFSGPMVRAILDKRKTQTRRVLKPQPPDDHPRFSGFYIVPAHGKHPEELHMRFARPEPLPHLWTDRCCYQPGDRLWARESITFNFEADNHYWSADNKGVGNELHRRLRPITAKGVRRFSATSRTLPSIHMPRWASRLTLYVTDVRVERVQEISEEDARAEGSETVGGQVSRDPPEWDWITAKENFAILWDEINGKGAWDRNDWVVAVTFTPRLGNIDSLPLELAA